MVFVVVVACGAERGDASGGGAEHGRGVCGVGRGDGRGDGRDGRGAGRDRHLGIRGDRGNRGSDDRDGRGRKRCRR